MRNSLQLALYRHWTVEASLKYSMSTAISLHLWSIRGEQRLREVLAEMGLPLVQSRQLFRAMDLTFRQEFQQMVEKLAGKYKVDSIVGSSFTLQYGYRFKYCASDMVYAMLALLDSTVTCRIYYYSLQFIISFLLIHMYVCCRRRTDNRNAASWIHWTVCRARTKIL